MGEGSAIIGCYPPAEVDGPEDRVTCPEPEAEAMVDVGRGRTAQRLSRLNRAMRDSFLKFQCWSTLVHCCCVPDMQHTALLVPTYAGRDASSHPRRRFASVIRGARCRPRKNTPIFLSLGNKKCCCRQRRRRRPSTTGRPRPRPGGRTEKRTIRGAKRPVLGLCLHFVGEVAKRSVLFLNVLEN